MTIISEIKKTLINDTDALSKVLEHYGYCNIKQHSSYISFGRNEDTSPKSIVIYTTNNDNIYVKDYPLNIDNQDIFAYITKQKHVEFIDVLNTIKKALGINSYEKYYCKPKKTAFGGWYAKIKERNAVEEWVTYPESILNKYERVGNIKFLRDHISLETQKYFQIGYDAQEEGITIPIKNEVGSLIGVKIRSNTNNGKYKYYYLIKCKESQTLFGYYQNYKYLFNNTIYIFEAEKSVMQCHSYGIRNAVALGSGSISDKQIELILQLNPKKVIFLHDNNYELEAIQKNINKLKSYSRFYKQLLVGYWDYTKSDYPEKCSPSDLGIDILNNIIQNEIVWQ